ncbi:hypothetical protein MIR68_000639 [Amoeboaphelidium protococcarum]|nr:hypothetical protein MIR68_000639 [Amoeboaphelidium protococcarum]
MATRGALNDDEVASEMKKMTEFIRQEAMEKAREIQVKADEEHNIEKAKLVRAETLNIEASYEKKKKTAVLQRKIQASAAANKIRLKVLEAREAALNDLLNECRKRLGPAVQKNGNQSQLTVQIILQGLLQLLPSADEVTSDPVMIVCKKSDVSMVEEASKQAVSEYLKIIQLDQGKSLFIQVDKNRNLPDSTSGGVVLVTAGGKIVCQNTLEARLDLAAEKMLPYLRMALYGASPSRRFFD